MTLLLMKLPIYFSLVLVIFNLISLYFIIDLLSYDEIVGYWFNGRKKNVEYSNDGVFTFCSNPDESVFHFFDCSRKIKRERLVRL